jgi:hypothetical protein
VSSRNSCAELARKDKPAIKELEERNASEHALRVIQADLTVQIQAQASNSSIFKVSSKENHERLRATEQPPNSKIQIALKRNF